MECPTYQAALGCLNESEYAAAAKLRLATSEGDLVVVEGYDGPQTL